MKRESYETCQYCEVKTINGNKYCSNKCKQKSHYHSRKDKNVYFNQFKRSIKRKALLIEQRGGKCEICGYNSNLSALEFHHTEPKNKLFSLNIRQLSNKSLQSIIKESEKCILICANCHREEHHPSLSFDNVKKIISTLDKQEFENEVKINKPKCLDCGKEINYTYKRCVPCKRVFLRKIKDRPNKSIIEQLILEKGITKTAKHFDVSRATIKRWLN